VGQRIHRRRDEGVDNMRVVTAKNKAQLFYACLYNLSGSSLMATWLTGGQPNGT
jgi:hypothetical protein